MVHVSRTIKLLISASDVDFSPFFETEKLFAPINIKLEEVDLLIEGPMIAPELGYVYMKKNSNKKENFRVKQKHLVYTNMLQKFISKYAKSQASDEAKKKLFKKLTW